MPFKRKDQSDAIEKIIFDTTYDAIVVLNMFNSNTVLMSDSTGFIVDVIQNRIIVMTCAHNILVTPTTINSNILLVRTKIELLPHNILF